MKSKLKLTLLLAMVMVFNLAFSQDLSVSGVVTSSLDNMPLPGVNVILKGTSTGVQTGFDGEYTINVEKGSVLVFSFLGMKTQEVVVESSVLDVILDEDAASLDEVVITAYGNKTTLERNTAAIATVSAESIEDRANASVLQNLQGQVSGLSISTSSGVPGADSTIIIRGQGSINGNIEPIFVVDNIIVDEDNFSEILGEVAWNGLLVFHSLTLVGVDLAVLPNQDALSILAFAVDGTTQNRLRVTLVQLSSATALFDAEARCKAALSSTNQHNKIVSLLSD